jgi:hypothetical protein
VDFFDRGDVADVHTARAGANNRSCWNKISVSTLFLVLRAGLHLQADY